MISLRVRDSVEIAPMGSLPARNLSGGTGARCQGFKSGRMDERSVIPQGGVDEVLRETLRLRLGANEDPDAEHDPIRLRKMRVCDGRETEAQM